MAASHRLQASCLLMLLLQGVAAAASTTTSSGRPQEEAEDPDIEPEDAAGYRTYIVMLERPSAADLIKLTDGADAHRAWLQSFLPSEKTVLGEPRLRSSYRTVFHGFSARLTKDELKQLSAKPGFVRAFPNTLDLPTR